MSRRLQRILTVLSGGILIAVFALVAQGFSAKAANLQLFTPDRIIDDAIFTNNQSMSAQDIQNFLNAKNSTCLKNFTTLSLSDDNGDGRVDDAGAEPYGKNGTMSAAQVIKSASDIYKINPQVILATLEKEQGLVTRGDCPDWRYNTALGYGCPDTAPCNVAAYGFTRQIDYGVYHLRGFFDDSLTYTPYGIGTYQIAYNPDPACGSSTITIQNRATAALYSYTPYQPNAGALAAGYGTAPCGAYGNRNFYLYFTDWFGEPKLPVAIKAADSASVFIQKAGYRFGVGSMALLQDYGISPASIGTVSSSVLSSIPLGNTNPLLSDSVGYIVKSESDSDSDQGAVYYIGVGKKYKFQNYGQFIGFGFNESHLKKLPLNFLLSIPDGGNLSDFIATPTNNVFRIENSRKRIIFDGALYGTLNPSQVVTRLSTAGAALIAPGKPITNSPVLVQQPSTAVYLFDGNDYYSVPSMDVYNCWGFSGQQSTKMFSLAEPDYIGQTTSAQPLGCSLKANSGESLVLSETKRFSLPADFTPLSNSYNSVVSGVAKSLPDAGTLPRYVKSNSENTVWYLEGNTKRSIPSMSNFQLLGASVSGITYLTNTAISEFSTGSLKLAAGQIVKSPSSPAIYLIDTEGKRRGFPSAESFTAYGNSWSSIETYSDSLLNAHYPVSSYMVSRFIATNDINRTYLIDGAGCKIVNADTLSRIAINRSSLPVYSASNFPYLNLGSCSNASNLFKSSTGSAVYYLNVGKKNPVSSWSRLLQIDPNPYITIVSEETINSLTTGPSA